MLQEKPCRTYGENSHGMVIRGGHAISQGSIQKLSSKFEMLISHMPAKDAFFSRGNIIFLIVITIIEIIVHYFTLSKKAK